MCGISGFIGKSKNPAVSYQLLTKLFEKTEVRGIDASGFWAVESGVNGKVYFHKEPVKAPQFIKKDIWRRLSKVDMDLAVVHCRQASQGQPANNKNNHPFVSHNRRLALVHNGKINGGEYDALKKLYEVTSDCDSEVLLRIIEGPLNPVEIPGCDDHHSRRLEGVREIYSLLNHSHMAVAIGERFDDGRRTLILFRNQYRPIWAADMRGTLGQVFFVSTPDIWNAAVHECKAVAAHLGRQQKLSEIPPEEVWSFQVASGGHCDGVQRYSVARTGRIRPWSYSGSEPTPVIRSGSRVEAITKLEDDDSVCKLRIEATEDVNTSGHLEIRDSTVKLATMLREIQQLNVLALRTGEQGGENTANVHAILHQIESQLQRALGLYRD